MNRMNASDIRRERAVKLYLAILVTAISALFAAAANAATKTVQVGPSGTLTFRDTATSMNVTTATVGVTVGNNFFSPSTVTVHVGDVVQWTWASGGISHSTTSGTCSSYYGCTPDGHWDSGLPQSSGMFSHTFTSAGTFPYYCKVHGASMTGTVVVTTPTPTPTPSRTPTRTATPTPALVVSLGANPSGGAAPLSTDLSAAVSGTATGTINYTFWWNCNDPGTSVSTVTLVCGDPTNLAIGAQFVGVPDNPKVVNHVYSSTGTYTAKVIGERGSAPPAESRAAVFVGPFSFFTLPPCRVVDTRNAVGAYGGPALIAGKDRSFIFVGQCGIPVGATAVSLNVTVVQPTGPGFLTLYPGGTTLPLAATINYRVGRVRANNAVVPLGAAGDISVRCGQGSGTVNLVIDVDGYFQ